MLVSISYNCMGEEKTLISLPNKILAISLFGRKVTKVIKISFLLLEKQ